MPIKGLTDQQASFPRIGELRKGEPKPAQGNRPGKDLQYFRFTSKNKDAINAFARAYGDTPNDIDIFLPYATASDNFEAWQEAWGAGGLVHRCDGEYVVRHQVNGEYHDPPYGSVKCPGGCKESGTLKVIIPALGRLAYVAAGTHSINDIVEVHANLTAYEALRGDLRGIPFILSRVPRMISTPGKDGKRVRREKWLLHIEAAPEWVQAQLSVMKREALPTMDDMVMLPETIDNDTGEIIEAETTVTRDEMDWQRNAYQLPAVKATFENKQRLMDWRKFVTGGEFNPAQNEKVGKVLKSYCNTVADGVKVSEAAQVARDKFAPLPDKEEITDPVADNHLIIKRKEFHAVGVETYGKEWKNERPKLVKSVRADLESSNDLDARELTQLINDMRQAS